MGYSDACLLAVLQGLTEFLPVSSSGHLVLVQYFLGSSGEIDLLYNIVLHVATAVALLTYFRRDLYGLCTGLIRTAPPSPSVFSGRERQTVFHIVLALIPTALLGLYIDTLFIPFFLRPDVVGCMLLLTGCLLWWGKGQGARTPTTQMHALHALVIGVLQGLAVIPGISRSGVTITGGILLGLKRELAARFSLLISIPAILGATLLEVSKLEEQALPPLGPYVAGMVVAGSVGYAAIALILRLVQQERFHLFAWYLWPLGGLVSIGFHLLG
ncbi:MAG: undecaprenyl-diphosphate phosphatase [Desulfurellaceae bacterium]|nr:undecaprenyl-diphosphate phosphatase [Desulfurellaceae bacterium]